MGLETLLLAENPFGDEGGTTLTQTLCSHNKTLHTLDVRRTQMSRSGEKQVKNTSDKSYEVISSSRVLSAS